jgi:hypothetical protein
MRSGKYDGSRICFRTNNLTYYLLRDLSRMYKVDPDDVLRSALDLVLVDPYFRFRTIEHVFRSREFRDRLKQP